MYYTAKDQTRLNTTLQLNSPNSVNFKIRPTIDLTANRWSFKLCWKIVNVCVLYMKLFWSFKLLNYKINKLAICNYFGASNYASKL